jgi:outer membrane lipoprotein-sorting protein
LALDARERSRIIPENYAFEMLGIEHVDGRLAYLVAIAPKTPNKYVMRGRIWIDAEDYAVVRIEGTPAKNPPSGSKPFTSFTATRNRDRSGFPSSTVR